LQKDKGDVATSALCQLSATTNSNYGELRGLHTKLFPLSSLSFYAKSGSVNNPCHWKSPINSFSLTKYLYLFHEVVCGGWPVLKTNIE